MRRLKLRHILIGTLCVAVLLLIVPRGRQTILGFARGESFYRGRPSSEWADRLRCLPFADSDAAREELAQGGSAAVPVLIECLGSDDAAEFNAFQALKQIGPEARAALPHLLLQAKSNTGTKFKDVREKQLVEAVASIGPEAIPVLAELARAEDRHLSWYASVHLGKFGPAAKSALPHLVLALKHAGSFWPVEDPAGDIRDAIVAIGPDAVPALMSALVDLKVPKRLYMIEALGKIGPEAAPAAPVIVTHLQTARDSWEINAIRFALVRIGQKAIPALITAVKQEDWWVKHSAIWTLGEMKAAEAVPVLIKCLDDESGSIRFDAIHSLGRIGPKAKDSVPALLKIYRSKHVPFGIARIHLGETAAFSLWDIDRDAARAAGIDIREGRR